MIPILLIFLMILSPGLLPCSGAASPPQTRKAPAVNGPAPESSQQVWRVGDRRWTEEEELAYGRWVEENVTEDFFVRHKISVDCADVLYAIRWIYARIAHLPAAASTKEGLFIGHWSTQWGRLPTHKQWDKDQRFRTALRHVLQETTTRILPLDTYPVRVDPDSIMPGTGFFITESHSGIVSRLALDGSTIHPVQTWESTMPAKVQKLNGRNFLSTRPESTTHSGLVKFRWPVRDNGKWKYLPVKEHPYYSEEQYSSKFTERYGTYIEAVAKRIDPVDYDPMEKLEKVLETVHRYLLERVPIVLEGYKRCRTGRCPEGSDLWETYSTPGRDGWILVQMDHLRHLVESNRIDPGWVRDRLESLRVPIDKGKSVSFQHVYQNYLWLSPDPEDSIEARWGLKKCDMIQTRLKSARASIAFIERTYSKRDPKYSAFATRQQVQTIRKLNEEWSRSACRKTMTAGRKSEPGGLKQNFESGRYDPAAGTAEALAKGEEVRVQNFESGKYDLESEAPKIKDEDSKESLEPRKEPMGGQDMALQEGRGQGADTLPPLESVEPRREGLDAGGLRRREEFSGPGSNSVKGAGGNQGTESPARREKVQKPDRDSGKGRLDSQQDSVIWERKKVVRPRETWKDGEERPKASKRSRQE